MSELPRHVAIIMDGNGRWARKRGLPRIAGHKAGIKVVRDIVTASRETGISFLTLYAFSSENWKRPRSEVLALMNLLKKFLAEELELMNEKGIRLRTIGHIKKMPKPVQLRLRKTIQATRKNTNMTLILALSYGARQEIVDAVSGILRDYKKGLIQKRDITEEFFSSYLYTRNIPDPDLLVRTSGEKRLSNFLLWQLSYAEFIFTDIEWPDFTKEDYHRILDTFSTRERRYGGLSG